MLLCAIVCAPLSAEVKLANIFTDNMVLQRDATLHFWGTSDPGDEIKIQLRDQIASGKTDASGNWKIQMQPIGLGDPFDVVVSGSKNQITLKNVVAGEVWICSGQSNMEWSVAQSGNPTQEIQAAKYPLIRHVKINRTIAAKPLNDVPNSGWTVCSPQTAANYTAVGYYFARHLHQKLNVPIGLINTSWGGTICEAWASGDALLEHPDFAATIQKFNSVTESELEQRRIQSESYGKALWNAFRTVDERQLQGKEIDTSSWKEMVLPAHWENRGLAGFDGVVWFRRQIEIPEAWVGKELDLSLGPIDDFDKTFVNEVVVGEIKAHNKPRQYKIPASAVADRNLSIAIRVTDTGGAGGIYGKPEQMTLRHGSEQPISLAGKWRMKMDPAFAQLPPRPPRSDFSGPNTATALYNGMIHPLIPFSFRGAIWYQGESNVGRGKQYQTLFPLMIKNWRAKWNQEFPFYWVQLANFTKPSTDPGPSGWAEIREAQTMALALPNTGQAVIIDIGEARDIHPKNKWDVGRRLAFNALAKTYGKTDVVYSGPLYREMKVEGDKIRVSFDYAQGLNAKGGELKRFEIAAADGKFVWAVATIDGADVLVSAEGITKPIAVRYAWADNPEGCNLYNAAGLPASPFRTDK